LTLIAAAYTLDAPLRVSRDTGQVPTGGSRRSGLTHEVRPFFLTRWRSRAMRQSRSWTAVFQQHQDCMSKYRAYCTATWIDNCRQKTGSGYLALKLQLKTPTSQNSPTKLTNSLIFAIVSVKPTAIIPCTPSRPSGPTGVPTVSAQSWI